MKKALSIATATALMLSLAACGSSAASSSAAPAADSTASSTAESSSAAESTGDKKDLTFGYIAYDMSDIWNEYSAKAFEYAAEQNGVKTVVLDSKNSLEDSVTAMESLIQSTTRSAKLLSSGLQSRTPRQRFSSALARKVPAFTRSTRKVLTAPWKSWAAM